MCRDDEVKDARALVRKHEEDVQDVKPDRRHGKEGHDPGGDFT
jgi:hypothetical protein